MSGAHHWSYNGNGSDDETEAYDVLGRLVTRTEYAASGMVNTSSSQYDLASNRTHLTYPSGRGLTMGFDPAERLSSVTDDTSGTSYFGNPQYFPNGALQQAVYGGVLQELNTLNNRLQPCESSFSTTGSSSPFMDRQYFYGANNTRGQQCGNFAGNNGNLMHVLDGAPNSVFEQDYSYDNLNRVKGWSGTSVQGLFRQQSFGYDSFGNMLAAWSGTAPTVTSAQFDGGNHLINQGGSDCTAYDSSGNMVCSGTTQSNESDLGFNEEEQLVISLYKQNNSPPEYIYNYDASGNRVRSDNMADNSFREYSYLEGQMLADRDNTGTWTDYIYANGKKIARVQSAVPMLHIHAQRDPQHINMDCGTNWWTDAMGSHGYTIRSGDKWVFLHKNINAVAGMEIQLSDGSFGWQHGLADQNGVGVEVLGDTGGAFVTRVVDLSSIAGMTISRTLVDINNQTPAGTYDVYYRSASIVSTDGTVTSMFNGQILSGGIWGACGLYNATYAVEQTPDQSNVAASYYVADQVGTAQEEVSSSGWPVWQGEYTPFGQELDTQFTYNRYKFTGKERDTESGLDYFGARYYASSMGRWMSPDWADKPEPVPYSKLDNPQSLNLYGYVLNNPLSKADPDGHCCWEEFKAIFYAKGSVGPGVGSEVKLTKYLSAGISAKATLETKVTSTGVVTTAVGEVKSGVKIGPADLSVKGSVEAQVLKNGAVDVQKPEVKTTLPSVGGGEHAEATPNEVGVSGHAGAFGGEVGIDVDKVKELGSAMRQSLSDLAGYLKDKATPPEPSQQNIPSPVPRNPF